MPMLNIDLGSAPPALLSGVIFGHHLGDVQENVISNVMRWAL